MQFPKTPHADGWQAHMPRLPRLRGRQSPATMPVVAHDVSTGTLRSRRGRRRINGLALLVAAGTLVAAATLATREDGRPLDVQVRDLNCTAGTVQQDLDQ